MREAVRCGKRGEEAAWREQRGVVVVFELCEEDEQIGTQDDDGGRGESGKWKVRET